MNINIKVCKFDLSHLRRYLKYDLNPIISRSFCIFASKYKIISNECRLCLQTAFLFCISNKKPQHNAEENILQLL